MKLLDLSLASPDENLACDEVLLNRAETEGGETLRFWESREHFVVVGYANKVELEVNAAACAAKHIPIFRRSSGGGTVLQGPGCLNYSLVLQISESPSLANISRTNEFIMQRHREAMEVEIKSQESEARILVCGHTDLALATCHTSLATPRKFSGNSQRRHKRALLFHGTFLLNFDLPLVSEFLRMPSKQPDYRNSREHGEFMTNLNLPATRIKQALRRIWNAGEKLGGFPVEAVQKLAADKYSTPDWNFKL